MGGLEIKEVSREIFLFSFGDVKDRYRVLEGDPWSFDYSPIVLKKVDDLGNLDLADFCYTNFWVQAHSLPLDSRLPEVGEVIGEAVGDLVKVHTNRNGKCSGKFVRVRSRIDITIIMVDLRYEKLPDFCYWCGKLGYIIKDCPASDVNLDVPEEMLPYGDWLRAKKPDNFGAHRNSQQRRLGSVSGGGRGGGRTGGRSGFNSGVFPEDAIWGKASGFRGRGEILRDNIGIVQKKIFWFEFEFD